MDFDDAKQKTPLRALLKTKVEFNVFRAVLPALAKSPMRKLDSKKAKKEHPRGVFNDALTEQKKKCTVSGLLLFLVL